MKTNILLIGLIVVASSFAVKAENNAAKMCNAYSKIIHDVAKMRFNSRATKQEALNAIQAALSGKIPDQSNYKPKPSDFAKAVVKRVYSLENYAPTIIARNEKLACLKIKARA